MATKAQIKRWMLANKEEHIDRSCNELNTTALTEAWDRECSTGDATLDPDHIAWDAASEVGQALDKQR